MKDAFRSSLLIVLVSLLGILLAAPSANAQNLYASIRGTVTDQSGAVIGGINLAATNVSTGVSYRTTSANNGAYSFLQLPIGSYTVSAEQSGFKKFETQGIHLDINQVYALDVRMEVGAVSQVLTVEATAAQVNTTDMQLGTTIGGNQIVDLPLNGRNWTQLEQLQPGVVGTTDRFGGNLGGFSGNGAETQQNSFLINGTDSNDPTLNTVLIVPSPDAIAEFRLVTNTLNPEYGRNSGTIINALIKNGSNQFHGDAFEFYRDTFMDAKSWFELTPSPFHRNDFGGTVGGPVVKDHTFFFFSYEGFREAFPQSHQNPNVYTKLERGGNFSADAGTFNANPIPFAMFGDSASPCPVGGAQCAAGSATYAQLFSTGMIPTQDFNPLAVKLMNQFVPLPNAGQTFDFNPTTTETTNQYIYRVDEQLKQSDALWFYGLNQSTPSQDSLPFTGATLPGFAEFATRHYSQYVLDWNHTFSPTSLNEARFGYTRFNFAAVEPVTPITPASYGFTGITTQDPAVSSLPLMTVNGLFTLGFSNNGPQPRVQDTYNFVDNFSKVSGHHTIKAGFDLDLIQVNNPFFSNLNGNFGFSGQGAFSTGIAGVDFLLGLPTTYNQGSGSTVRNRGREYYSYIQDQWKVKNNLTLTIGTGWDVETPWRNLFGNGEINAAWRPGQQSTIFPGMPVGFVYPGDAGINQYGGQSIHWHDFAPRLGFAWSPTGSGKWSVRGGIGLYYNRSESELALQTLGNPPFAVSSTGALNACGSVGFATPFISANGTCSSAQVFPFTPPTPGSTFSPVPFEPIGLGTVVADPRFTAPRATNYNLTIERQLDNATVLSLSYVGNQGRHEEGAIDLNLAGLPNGTNPAAAAFLSQFPGQPAPTQNCTSGFALGSPACPPSGTPGGTPYNLGVYGETGEELTEFNSHYNSLQIELNRRFSNGLQVLAAYTWSRYFDQTSSLENGAFNFPGINTFNYKSMWGPSTNDAPQRFVVSYQYTLPIFKLTHHWRPLTDGWNILGIYTLQHGTPVAVFDFGSSSLDYNLATSFFAGPDRANQNGTPIAFGNPRSSGNLWVTNGSSVFGVPAPGAGIGNANRNPFYGPGINYTDMAIEKDIHISESKYFEVRLETFNTFNHANFANPTTPGFGSGEDASEPASFGQIFSVIQGSTNGDGRVLQLGAKFYF